jgi:hypothetical protein
MAESLVRVTLSGVRKRVILNEVKNLLAGKRMRFPGREILRSLREGVSF